MMATVKREAAEKSYIPKASRSTGVFSGGSPLRDEEKLVVLRLYAENFSFAKINLFMVEHFNINVTKEMVGKIINAPGASQMIRKLQIEYCAKLMDVPVSNKRIRLDKLNTVMTKTMVEIEENDMDDSQKKLEFREAVKILNTTLNSARVEIEGNPSIVTNIMINDFSDKSDEELRQMRQELIEQAKRAVMPKIDKTAELGEIIDVSRSIGSTSSGN